MDLVFKKQTDFILSRGHGIKACLFDEETKHSIGNIIPYSKFQDHDFFYFDFLGNKDRVAISDISCIVIIRSDSLKVLIDELAAPFYSNYIILFTNQIDPFVLEILANSDTKCLVSEVHEIYLDLHRQSACLYTTGSSRYKRVLDGLHSLIMTLEIIPSVLLDEQDAEAAGDKNFLTLGRDLSMKAQQYNFQRAGTVVLLKRGFDLVTPLLFDWHYQALICEHLACENGVVRLNGREYSITDAFFERNKFNNIHHVGDNIKGLVKELERNKIKISNHEFEDIEEKAAHSLMAETHLTIYNTVLEMCMANREQSEAEMRLVRDGSADLEEKLESLEEGRRLKYLLLHFLRSACDWGEEGKRFPKQRHALQRFQERYSPRDSPYKPTFNTEVDPKLGYEPPLKKMVKHLILNKLRSGALGSIGDAGVQPGPIIIYIEGGVAMCEYREVMKLAAEMRNEVYIVSDRVINYKSIINEVTRLP